MTKPRRVQRKRVKGWRMPVNTVSVCRPGKFGNPFKPEECRDAGYTGTDLEIKQRCVDAFRAWLVDKDGWLNWQGDEAERRKAEIIEELDSLRGKNLACYCKLDEPCHADVLLELANAPRALSDWQARLRSELASMKDDIEHVKSQDGSLVDGRLAEFHVRMEITYEHLMIIAKERTTAKPTRKRTEH